MIVYDDQCWGDSEVVFFNFFEVMFDEDYWGEVELYVWFIRVLIDLEKIICFGNV